jgi:multiple antibiotic resistance protein
MRAFWLCFVPMFVAVDALGILPFFFNLTERLSNSERRRVVRQSVITAALVAMAFLFGGSALLKALGVTVSDFMVAGGVLLFIIALRDVLGGPKTRRSADASSMGAVPIGVPLITGPAVLTTEVLLSNEHGAGMTAAAVILNIGIAGLVFTFADRIHGFLGRNGAKALSKIAALILASIAVMMVRKGVMQIIAGAGEAAKSV